MQLSRDDAESVCARILAMTTMPDCMIALNGWGDRHIRFASRGGATNGVNRGARAAITCGAGLKRGRASATALDDDSLREAVRAAEEAARQAPENPETMPPLGPQQYSPSAAYVEATARLPVAALAGLLEPAAVMGRETGVDIAGFATAWTSWRAAATSAGLFAYDRASAAGLRMTVRNRRGTWSGWAGAEHADAARLDAAAVARTAIEKARAEPDPVMLEPGKYVVLLEPAAVGQFVSTLMGHFDARSADEGRSFLTRKGGGNRLDELVFDPRVAITSDPADPEAPGYAFDESGLPNRKVAWIEDGIVRMMTRSRYWAQKTGADPVSGPGCFNMKGGDVATADMIRDVKRGVLVTRLWYVRQVDARSVLQTGLTRDGTFLIENGRIAGPASNFRFNESPVALLNNILAIGPSRRRRVPDAWNSLAVPPLLAKDFTFSSISPAV